MKLRIPSMVAACALSCAAIHASAAVTPSTTPVQAELMADMHARLLRVGSPVFARVTVDWQGANCVLKNGAILEGHVIAVVPDIKPAKGSEVSLAFTRAQCGQMKMSSFDLLLAALAAPPSDSDLGLLSEHLPVGRGIVKSGSLTQLGDANNYNIALEAEIYQFPLVPKMPMGYVTGIRGLKLSVGTGPDDSSVLTAKNHDVELLKHTLLLLIPAEGVFPRAEVAPAVAREAAPSAASPDSSGKPSKGGAVDESATPSEDIDLCAPPQCSVALPSSEATDIGDASASISIDQLGYSARPRKEMSSFDNDDALAYLGPRELLVAFNPHKLVQRHQVGRSGSTVRVIRAALVDTETRRVTRTFDWDVTDTRQYLWPLTEGRVLVHVGSELRVYGAGLKIQNRISLDGPLAFLRVTPDGNFIAAGIIREGHSEELHQQLTQSLNGSEPEEDVTILVLNRNFETIAKSAAKSGLMAPTLLNEGQARLLAMPNMRYRIALQTWDNKTENVTRFNSGCTPELSSVAPDLIFLVSCDKRGQGREYRVLRTDGRLLLKGEATQNELGHAAAGIAGREVFVVKTVQSTLPAPPGELFRADSFASERLGVYRATDGKRLFGIRVNSPSPSRDGYALSPDGAQLAVLTRDQLAVFPIAAK